MEIASAQPMHDELPVIKFDYFLQRVESPDTWQFEGFILNEGFSSPGSVNAYANCIATRLGRVRIYSEGVTGSDTGEHMAIKPASVEAFRLSLSEISSDNHVHPLSHITFMTADRMMARELHDLVVQDWQSGLDSQAAIERVRDAALLKGIRCVNVQEWPGQRPVAA